MGCCFLLFHTLEKILPRVHPHSGFHAFAKQSKEIVHGLYFGKPRRSVGILLQNDAYLSTTVDSRTMSFGSVINV